MSFFVYHRYGSAEPNPDLSVLPLLLDELNERPEDTEHGQVSLTHDTEWCLSASLSGVLIWENLESGEPKHMLSVSREAVLRLWGLLARGEISTIDREPWLPGYPR